MLSAECCNYTKCLPPSLLCSFLVCLLQTDIINCLYRDGEESGSSLCSCVDTASSPADSPPAHVWTL